MLVTELINHGVYYFDFFAKSAVAFFKISRLPALVPTHECAADLP